MKDIHANISVPLCNLASLSSGFSFRGRLSDLEPGDVAMIQMRNVDPEFGIDWSSVARVELPSTRKISWLEARDILFVARGVNYYASVVGNMPCPSVCAPHFFVLKPNQNCNSDFLAWQINQAPAQEYLRKSAEGTNILNIRRNVLENLRIVLPSEEQQKTIVAYAKSVAEERRRLEGRIANRKREMEAIARSLFKNEGARG